jgi:hypothetical protein
VKEEADLRLKIDSLTRKVEALSVSQSVNSTNFPPREGCSLCGNQMHKAQNCHSLSSFTENSMEKVNAFHDFRKQSGGPFSETYNPGWQNHPNFSWRENQPLNQGGFPNQAHNQYPPGFRAPPQNQFSSSSRSTPQFVAQPRQQSSLEESLKAFMQSTQQAIQEIRSSTQMNTQAISKLENQVGQLVTHVGEREKGKFPNQPVPNPKEQCGINNSSSSTHDQEHVQSITTLRSNRQIDNQVKTPEFEKTNTTQSSQDDHRHDMEKDNPKPISIPLPIQDPSSSQPIAASPTVKNFVPKAPFPQRLARPNKGAQYGDILELFTAERRYLLTHTIRIFKVSNGASLG